MAQTKRPTPVGRYELLEDTEWPSMSVRVLRMAADAARVDAHVHMHSSQVYLVLEGTVAVTLGGVETVIGPYQTLAVPVGQMHSARPVNGPAIIANISVPPLGSDDQLPRSPELHPSDLDLPTIGSDFDD